MEQRQNQGYIITDSIHIGKVEFVIGEHPKAPSPFVTWECSGGNNYFWGHYYPDRRSAEQNLLSRAQAELTYLMQQEETAAKANEPEKADSGDWYNAMKIEYEPFFIYEHDSLYTDKRIDKSTVPKGMHAYELRYDDSGDLSTMERHVGKRFAGTVILNKPVSLGRHGCKEIKPDDYGFHEEKLCSLADYMKTHPPKTKAPER